ncbi:hypothetical protein E2C01_087018 [Portunus trituberculatus]|uniref:Uncharacterized protein n=1 Tax=Portunus trituberculatus TaxID=210409 RepID=A0A5B7J717_PORTR|nr:hypothetical protein [Portunus trituberculatus]
MHQYFIAGIIIIASIITLNMNYPVRLRHMFMNVS